MYSAVQKVVFDGSSCESIPYWSIVLQQQYISLYDQQATQILFNTDGS